MPSPTFSAGSPALHRYWLSLMVLAWGVLSSAAWVAGQEPKQSWAEKMFSSRRHDFGTVGRGQAVQHSLEITNLFKETVTISEVSSSCACIIPTIENRSLASKEVTQLRMKLDTDRFSYQRSVTVKVRMSFVGGGERVVLIQISAFIDPSRPAVVAQPPVVQEVAKTELSWADKMFSSLKHDFEAVARGAEVSHAISISNQNVETVTITDVRSSCLCVVPVIENRTILSRETIPLNLKLDTLAFQGKRDATITVTMTFDNTNFKSVRIPISAYIRRDVVIQPASVEFGTVAPGEEAQKVIQINYAGRESWTIREVRVPNPLITTDLNLVRRTGGYVDYELVVKLKAGASPEELNEQIVLVTDDAVNTHVPLVVRGEVAQEFQITPDTIKLGTMLPGVASNVTFAIKGRKAFLIDKVESNSNRECFKVNLPSSEKPIQVVKMTVTPPDQLGVFEEKFTVTIVGRSAPLTFKAVGMIEAAPEAKPEEVPLPAGDAPPEQVAPKDNIPSQQPQAGEPPAETPPSLEPSSTEPVTPTP